jgi:hypothetical protein
VARRLTDGEGQPMQPRRQHRLGGREKGMLVSLTDIAAEWEPEPCDFVLF